MVSRKNSHLDELVSIFTLVHLLKMQFEIVASGPHLVRSVAVDTKAFVDLLVLIAGMVDGFHMPLKVIFGRKAAARSQTTGKPTLVLAKMASPMFSNGISVTRPKWTESSWTYFKSDNVLAT
jgi:hypothetical protein